MRTGNPNKVAGTCDDGNKVQIQQAFESHRQKNLGRCAKEKQKAHFHLENLAADLN